VTPAVIRVPAASGWFAGGRRRSRAVGAALAWGALSGCGRLTPRSTELHVTERGGVERARNDALPLRPCGEDLPRENCFVITAARSGLDEEGVNAGRREFALRPAPGRSRRLLLLFLNGTWSAPRAAATGPVNWLTAGRDAGLHVLAVSYRSDEPLATLCTGPAGDACFVPSRETLLTGVFHPGAAPSLATIRPDEGIYTRTAAALAALARADRGGGWDDFVDLSKLETPEESLGWDRIMVSGHSQGGGHAALIGRDHRVERVLMLAAPCDGGPTGVASWLSSPRGYATDPGTRFRGLASAADAPCANAPLAWAALGMPKALARTDAIGCEGVEPHFAPLCAVNAPAWASMLE